MSPPLRQSLDSPPRPKRYESVTSWNWLPRLPQLWFDACKGSRHGCGASCLNVFVFGRGGGFSAWLSAVSTLRGVGVLTTLRGVGVLMTLLPEA